MKPGLWPHPAVLDQPELIDAFVGDELEPEEPAPDVAAWGIAPCLWTRLLRAAMVGASTSKGVRSDREMVAGKYRDGRPFAGVLDAKGRLCGGGVVLATSAAGALTALSPRFVWDAAGTPRPVLVSLLAPLEVAPDLASRGPDWLMAQVEDLLARLFRRGTVARTCPCTIAALRAALWLPTAWMTPLPDDASDGAPDRTEAWMPYHIEEWMLHLGFGAMSRAAQAMIVLIGEGVERPVLVGHLVAAGAEPPTGPGFWRKQRQAVWVGPTDPADPLGQIYKASCGEPKRNIRKKLQTELGRRVFELPTHLEPVLADAERAGKGSWKQRRKHMSDLEEHLSDPLTEQVLDALRWHPEDWGQRVIELLGQQSSKRADDLVADQVWHLWTAP